MTYDDYHHSRRIVGADNFVDAEPTFNTLIMAAMRRADSSNAAKLQLVFPEIWRELSNRFHSPDGLLEGERVDTAI